MRTAATSIRSAPPPRPLMRWLVNPVMRLLLRSPMGRRLPSLLLLEFTGRRTGRGMRVPVLGHPFGDHLYVCTDAPWAANFESGRELSVVRAGRRRAACGRLVAD